MKNLKILMLMVLAFLPVLSFGQVLSPNGSQNAWDLYVYGNGRVIGEIFSAIKLMMVPEGGGGGFRNLLLLLSSVGFITLAVAAGFDPGKNFMRMFTYIFVVWFVSFGSTQLKMNVVIHDQVTNNGLDNLAPIYQQSGVPALVAFPGVLTSLVGKYFAESIETNFVMPGDATELKMAGSTGVGQFNLFGKMIKESQQYVITSPELKKTVSQYMVDCTIPAIALGRLVGPGPVVSNSATTLKGLEALMGSTNLVETLRSASSPAILTKYFPFSAEKRWAELEGGVAQGGTMTQANVSTVGALVTCEQAFNYLEEDLEDHAENLVDATSAAWERTGVNVGYQELFKKVLVGSSLVGSGGQANGYIMQTAMINSMKGSFRQAAIQTGNNEMMQAAALAQAEAAQWSAWSAGFSTFNNMMGYVYTVLQAFIFAITPLIIITLVIPGMGKSIFVNYMQILVWLALWMPTLAIINFLITLFAADSVGGIASASGGPSYNNKALITESVNHTMVAAQFLGTMVPLISWGIVKGAMAFTEFISKGIGNNFAEAAGQSAATGNISMNNMSMDNTSLNSFSSVTSAKVGSQGVSTASGIGSSNVTQDLSGTNTRANGGAVEVKFNAADAAKAEIASAQQFAQGLTSSTNQSVSLQDSISKAASTSSTASEQQVATAQVNAMLQTTANGTSATAKQDAATAASYAHTQGVAISDKTLDSIGISLKMLVGAGVDSSNTQDASNAAQSGVQRSSSMSDAIARGNASLGDSASIATSEALSRSLSHNASVDSKIDMSKNTQYQEAISTMVSENNSISKSRADSYTAGSTAGFSDGVGGMVGSGIMTNVAGAQGVISAGGGMPHNSRMEAQAEAMKGSLSDAAAKVQKSAGSLSSAARSEFANKAAGVQMGAAPTTDQLKGSATYATFEKTTADATARVAEGEAKISAAIAERQAQSKAVEGAATNARGGASGALQNGVDTILETVGVNRDKPTGNKAENLAKAAAKARGDN